MNRFQQLARVNLLADTGQLDFTCTLFSPSFEELLNSFGPHFPFQRIGEERWHLQVERQKNFERASKDLFQIARNGDNQTFTGDFSEREKKGFTAICRGMRRRLEFPYCELEVALGIVTKILDLNAGKGGRPTHFFLQHERQINSILTSIGGFHKITRDVASGKMSSWRDFASALDVPSRSMRRQASAIRFFIKDFCEALSAHQITDNESVVGKICKITKNVFTASDGPELIIITANGPAFRSQIETLLLTSKDFKQAVRQVVKPQTLEKQAKKSGVLIVPSGILKENLPTQSFLSGRASTLHIDVALDEKNALHYGRSITVLPA